MFGFKVYKMNEIVNKLLLAGDKFMLEMYLKKLDLLILLVVHLQKTKKELKSLWRLGIHILFTEMSSINLVSTCYGLW